MNKTVSFEDIPKALEPYCEINMNSTRMLVYSGSFALRCGRATLELEGEISYSLYGGLQLVFEGKAGRIGFEFFISKKAYYIRTSNGLTGRCIIGSFTSSSNGNTYCRGFIQHLFASQKKCSCWYWSYLNMTKFHGELVTRVYENHRTTSTDRLSFLCIDGTVIIAENTDNQNNPKSNNQYVITHHCKLIPANGKKIDFNSAKKYIIAFSHFISFVVGKYHSPILIEGLNKKEQHYPYYYSGYDTSRYNVISWLPYPKDIDIESLWPTFEEVWNGDDKDKADVLNTAIHWYLEANSNSGKVEGALIMAMTGVDLMCNVILPKNEQGKMRLQNLLKRINYKKKYDPSFMRDTRNQLVHYDEDNRKKYQTLTRKQKLNCLEKTLNILELAILYWLGYTIHYADRTHANKWRGASTKMVPWSRHKSTGVTGKNNKPKNK